MYAVIQRHGDDVFYLNHSCMSSLSFGSPDMAWVTDDYEKAELMAEKCERRHGTECEVYPT